MDKPEDLLNMLPPEVITQIYTDAASKPLVEISNLGTDIIKTARLLLAPLQITSSLQERFEKFLKTRVSKIPEDRLIESPSMIIGPALEKMKFLSYETPIWKMFEELLLKSVDKEQIDKAHPSFVHIISQLSHDEAILLFELSKYEFEVTDTLDLDKINNRFINRKIEKSTIPTKLLNFQDNESLYYNHLESLSLITWPVIKETPIVINNNQVGTRRYSKWILTDFGKLFTEACIPEEGFNSI